MAIRDFFRGERDGNRDSWRDQWRDDRYPQRYSSGSDSPSRREPEYGSRDDYRSQRGPQFYGQSGRSDWADQRNNPRDRDYSRDQDRRDQGSYERTFGERNASGWNEPRDPNRQQSYHGGFYAGETGRESTYRTEPSGQGDWGRDSQRWGEQSQQQQRSRGPDEWRPFESHEQGEHRGRGPKGYQRSDQRIHEEVCECLTEDAFVDASNIEINVQSGIVTLTGTVNSRREKRHAEDLVENLPGVKDVNNSLRVGEDSSSAAQATRQNDATSTDQLQPRQPTASQQTPRH
jgi:hypothetical protein